MNEQSRAPERVTPQVPAWGRRKSVEAAREGAEADGLRRRLGPVALVMLGIGCIVGAGIYVIAGTAAAQYAGPAVVLSLLVSAVACGLIGLCYAELASVLPVAGASYSYAYACLGEIPAWIVGWMMVLEFGLGVALLAVGFSGYLVSLLGDFGWHLPAAISSGTWQAQGGHFAAAAQVNLVALVAVAVAAAVLIRGISQSAGVNGALVAIKSCVLVGFVAVGIFHVHPANWTPFLPANEGGFHYGIAGVLRAASILFFSYLGFEAVATAASEARRPQRDIPVGILGALAVSTALYIAVALVMTGLVPYRQLGVAAPIAVAIHALAMPALSVAIKCGALAGLGSVLLVDTYALSRICFAMARDGLLPAMFGRLHGRFATPAQGTVAVATVAGLAAALLPISLLADLVSIGTGIAFLIVATSVIRLRAIAPDLERPFRVPGGGVRVGGVWLGTVPVLAIATCTVMVAPVVIDLAMRALHGEWLPPGILLAYLTAGAAIYVLYGRRHSRVGTGA